MSVTGRNIDINSQTLNVKEMINLESSTSHTILADKVGKMLVFELNPLLEVTQSHGTDDWVVSWGFDCEQHNLKSSFINHF